MIEKAAHRIGRYQSLHHLVPKAPWDAQTVPDVACWRALPAPQQTGPIQAWILNDTGVARQYCPPLGKRENSQVAVSLPPANEHARLPVAFQLYLPEEWADDPEPQPKADVSAGTGPAPSPRLLWSNSPEPSPRICRKAVKKRSPMTLLRHVESTAWLCQSASAPTPISHRPGGARSTPRERRLPQSK
jgi:SRSO17 transposase